MDTPERNHQYGEVVNCHANFALPPVDTFDTLHSSVPGMLSRTYTACPRARDYALAAALAIADAIVYAAANASYCIVDHFQPFFYSSQILT